MIKFKHIFIVEDDPISALLIKKSLDKIDEFGQHYHFSNGKLAIEGLKKFSRRNGGNPSLILLDINMPVMNGWQFLDFLVKDANFSSIEIVILSSSIDPTDIDKSKVYHNVSGFLSKPLNVVKLKKLVKLL